MPYTLQAFPARDKVAVKPYMLFTTFEALYPGQTVCALTACGSKMFGRTGGVLETEESSVGIALYVMVTPSLSTVFTDAELRATDDTKPSAALLAVEEAV